MSTYFLIIIVSVAAGTVIGFYINSFVKLFNTEKIKIIKNWLLYAVSIAEKQLGSGTGALKLAKVYNEFVEKFPQFAKDISYQKFSELVDQVLEEFKNILQKNKNINAFIKG